MSSEKNSSSSISSKSQVVVSLDLETTGLSTARDRIVEIALVKLDLANGKRERWTSLVQPTIPIPLHVQAIHGITDEMVQHSKTFQQLVPELLAFLPANATLCGHNLIRFDLPLLQAELVRSGHKPLDLSRFHLVDSLVIFRKMEPHTLTKAVEFYCGSAAKAAHVAHRAQGDAEAALDVWLAQKDQYAHLFGTDPKAMADFCGDPHARPPLPLPSPRPPSKQTTTKTTENEFLSIHN